MDDPTPLPNPPLYHGRCPNHQLPMKHQGTFDGEHGYECPAPNCTVTLWIAIDSPRLTTPEFPTLPPQP